MEIKDYMVMIDWKKFFGLPVNNDLIIFNNTQKITNGKRDNYTTGCLLDYNCLKNYYKMIAKDLSKKQAFYADPKAIQQNKVIII